MKYFAAKWLIRKIVNQLFLLELYKFKYFQLFEIILEYENDILNYTKENATQRKCAPTNLVILYKKN